ncbi:MAG: CBS domain-containing protein [Sedimenticolaceae bacterium]|jgi:CBS domain-containing protein
MTVENIMSFRLVRLKPTDRVCDALRIMHEQQIRNLPVVDEDDQFVGLFGIRPLVRLLLPEAAKIKYGLKDLSFMSDDAGALHDRLREVANKPVSDFLEKKKKLTFCKPSTSFPEVLELLDQSSDSSLPVIVVKGKHKRLVGMVSSWDVLEKIVMGMTDITNDCSGGGKGVKKDGGALDDQIDPPGLN